MRSSDERTRRRRHSRAERRLEKWRAIGCPGTTPLEHLCQWCPSPSKATCSPRKSGGGRCTTVPLGWRRQLRPVQKCSPRMVIEGVPLQQGRLTVTFASGRVDSLRLLGRLPLGFTLFAEYVQGARRIVSCNNESA